MKCPKCNTEKKSKDFYTRGTPGSRAAYCKDCFNSYCIKRWIQRKLDAVSRMGSCCQDCKHTFHYSVYEFHHLYSKDVSWTKMRLWNIDKMNKELVKCVLLCANCHRTRHWAN